MTAQENPIRAWIHDNNAEIANILHDKATYLELTHKAEVEKYEQRCQEAPNAILNYVRQVMTEGTRAPKNPGRLPS